MGGRKPQKHDLGGAQWKKCSCKAGGAGERMKSNMAAIALLLGFFVLVIWVTRLIVADIRRKAFSRIYDVSPLPSSVGIIEKNPKQCNCYVLGYPYWRVPKKDGSADLRVRNNGIVWPGCQLYFESYTISMARPTEMTSLVQELRRNGFYIEMCQEEQQKFARMMLKKQVQMSMRSIENVISYYASTPTNFEKLCAEIFRMHGYEVYVTPPTNDGGYDLLLMHEGQRTIVECKCYALEHKIGRPLLQKLVGANSVAMAEHMLFITTSDFSSGAVAYARETGVELMNGEELLHMLEDAGMLNQENAAVTMEEWQLSRSDLRFYVGKDLARWI